MRALFICVLAVLTMLGAPGHAENRAISDQRFDISIRDQNVRDVLTELSVAIGVPIIVSNAVSGRVSASFNGASATDLLNRISDERALDWRYDGRRIEVTARSEQTTRIFDLGGVALSDLAGALQSLGVLQPQFPITAVDREFAMIVAPPGYIAIVEVVAGALAERHGEARQAARQAEADKQARARAAQAAAQREFERQRVLQLEAERRARQGPRVVRNGVWGG